MTAPEVTQVTAKEFDLESLQDWLGDTAPELFREYLLPSRETRRRLLSNRFKALLTKAGAEIWLCRQHGKYLGIIGFERLDWDSRHFGVECGRLSPYCLSRDLDRDAQSEIHKLMLARGIEWARVNHIKVLQRRLLSGRLPEINVLEDFGFHMVDNVVTLTAPIKTVLSMATGINNDITVRPPARSELQSLLSMTHGAFPYSRFVNDRVLAPSLGDELYAKWVGKLFGEATESAAAMRAEQGIILAISKNTIAGYVAYRVERESAAAFGKCIGAIELIVVDPAFQGMRIGQNLFREASRVLNESGADLLESSTWINQRVAMASNQKAGLRVSENMLTYHSYC